MPTISSILQNLMLKIPMDLEEYSAFSKGQETEAVKQAFAKDQVVGKLVCFFCNEEFEGVDILNFHQRKCSSVCDIQTVLANSKSSQSKKRRFLSQLNVISKGKAEHLRLTKRQDVVVDVIVIDDSSDDEDGSIIERKSLRYLQATSNNKKKSLSNRRLCSAGKSSGGGQMRVGKFLRQSWKVFKFDISSPLGKRFRYRDSCDGDPRLPHCHGFMDYERYCCDTLGTSETLSSDKSYPVTFRKTRHLKYTHRYKFTRKQLQKFCLKKKCGLSIKSRKLKQQMKPCSIELKKLAFCFGESRKVFFDVAEVMRRQLPKCRFAFESEIVGEEMISFSDNVCEVKDVRINALLHPTARQVHNSTDEAIVDCDTSMFNGTSAASRGFHLNTGRTPPMCSVTSPLPCPATAAIDTADVCGFRLSFGNVQLVPLSALCEQTFHDRREDDVCQISSVFSLAETALADDIRRERCHAEERATCSAENTDSSENELASNTLRELMDFESQLIREDTVISDAKSCDFPDRPASLLHHPDPNDASAPSFVADPPVIDLTEPLLQFGEIISKTMTRETRRSSDVAMASDLPAPIDDVVTSLLSASRREIQQVAAKPILIEIPDEDATTGETMCQAVYVQPSEDLTTDNATVSSSETVSTFALGRHCDQTAVSSSCGLLKQVDNILERLLCSSRAADSTHPHLATVQPTQSSAVQNSDLIDLSADSDCELMGSEPLVNVNQSPSAEEALCLARSRRPGTRSLLGNSPLPPLTFRCHICHCIFEFSKDCGTLIKNHYRNHNVTNIELIKHRHPNGKVMWSLVEVNDGSALALPPPPPVDIGPSGCRDSVLHPSVTMHYPPPPPPSMANSDDENFPNDVRSTAVSQKSHLGRPLTRLLLDKNPLGSRGGTDSFDNCWKQRGCAVAAAAASHNLKPSLASGDGTMLQSGSCCELRPLPGGHTHSRDAAGPKPCFQKNPLNKACKLTQPEFHQPPDCEREKSDSRQMIEIHANVPKPGMTKDLGNSSRGKLLQRQQNYNSFGAYNNLTQGVICLD